MKKNKRYTESSGNVFADLGAPNPEEKLAKAELALQVNQLIEQRELTQEAAANLLGVDQPKISALKKGKLAGFSLERLFRFLNVLGHKITITISPKKKSNTTRDVTVTFSKIKKPAFKKPSITKSKVILAKKKKNPVKR